MATNRAALEEHKKHNIFVRIWKKIVKTVCDYFSLRIAFLCGIIITANFIVGFFLEGILPTFLTVCTAAVLFIIIMIRKIKKDEEALAARYNPENVKALYAELEEVMSKPEFDLDEFRRIGATIAFKGFSVRDSNIITEGVVTPFHCYIRTKDHGFDLVTATNYKFDLKFIPQKYQDNETGRIYYCLDIKTPEIKMSTTELYFAESDGEELKEVTDIFETSAERSKELVAMLGKRAKEYDI